MRKPLFILLGLLALLGADAINVDQHLSPVGQVNAASLLTHRALLDSELEASPSSKALVPVARNGERPTPEEETIPGGSDDANSFEFAIGVLAHEFGLI